MVLSSSLMEKYKGKGTREWGVEPRGSERRSLVLVDAWSSSVPLRSPGWSRVRHAGHPFKHRPPCLCWLRTGDVVKTTSRSAFLCRRWHDSRPECRSEHHAVGSPPTVDWYDPKAQQWTTYLGTLNEYPRATLLTTTKLYLQFILFNQFR